MSWQCLVCLNKDICPDATTDLAAIVYDMLKMDADLKQPCEAYESGCEGKDEAYDTMREVHTRND